MASNFKLSALKRSAIAISSVVIVEVTLGLTVNSLAIVSDGLHALLDALTTVMLFVATRAAFKPPDEEHMYGHEKFESIGGLVGGIALIGIALLIFYEAILKVFSGQTIKLDVQYIGFVAIGYTFCVDFFRVGTLIKARKSESTTMRAGFYHAIADLSSTIIALLGFGLATLGFYYGDSLASLVLGGMLSFLSVKLVWSSTMELADTVPKDIADKVRRGILDTNGVRKCKDLKIRKAGEKMFIRATVQLPDFLGLEEAHDLTSRIEANIRAAVGNAEVVIHTEPSETDMPTEKLVERLASEIQGVKQAHEITTTYTDGKLYITLHVYVNPELSVEEAHQIAEKIEGTIESRIRDVQDVMVHVEPFSCEKRKGPSVNEEEIRRIVHGIAGTYQHAFRIKRITTYVAGKKRYINIDCLFTKQISIEDAHEVSSQIEEQVKAHFTDTTVTVHMEPN